MGVAQRWAEPGRRKWAPTPRLRGWGRQEGGRRSSWCRLGAPLRSPLLCACHGPCCPRFGPELSPSPKSTPCSKGPWAPRARPAGSSSLGPQSSQLTATADPRPSTRSFRALLASPTDSLPTPRPGSRDTALSGHRDRELLPALTLPGGEDPGLRQPRSHLVLATEELNPLPGRRARAKAGLPTNLRPRSPAALPPPQRGQGLRVPTRALLGVLLKGPFLPSPAGVGFLLWVGVPTFQPDKDRQELEPRQRLSVFFPLPTETRAGRLRGWVGPGRPHRGPCAGRLTAS